MLTSISNNRNSRANDDNAQYFAEESPRIVTRKTVLSMAELVLDCYAAGLPNGITEPEKKKVRCTIWLRRSFKIRAQKIVFGRILV